MIPHRASSSSNSAFSLIEVALAVGIISFALIAVVGLLPVGLDSTRQANQQAQAVQNLNMLAVCLQGASVTSGTYTALAPFNSNGGSGGQAPLTWPNDGPQQQGQTIYLDESGLPVSAQAKAAMIALVQITPGGGLSPACAHIGVVWPVLGTTVSWSGANFTLKNQQGFVESVVYIHAQ